MRTDDEFPFQYLHRQVLLQHPFEEDGSPHHQRLVPETGGQFHPGRIGQQVGLRSFEEHHHLRGGGPVPGSVDLVPGSAGGEGAHLVGIVPVVKIPELITQSPDTGIERLSGGPEGRGSGDFTRRDRHHCTSLF